MEVNKKKKKRSKLFSTPLWLMYNRRHIEPSPTRSYLLSMELSEMLNDQWLDNLKFRPKPKLRRIKEDEEWSSDDDDDLAILKKYK